MALLPQVGLDALVIEVVLPTYNGAAYLRQQVASIDQQTLRPQRLIIRDDGSTDGTRELLASLKQDYGDWLALLPADGNLGCSANVNRLLEITRAPYVALADQDDHWLPGKLEASLTLLKQLEQIHGVEMPLMVHSDLSLIDGDGMPLGCSYLQLQRLDPSRTGLDDLLLTNVVTGCTVLLNQALLKTALPIPAEALMHDWWLALVASATGVIGFLPEPAVLYRQHGSNVLGARGTGLLVMTGRFLRPSVHGPRALFQAVVRQASLLQHRFNLPELTLVRAMAEGRLLRCWRLCLQPARRRKFLKHGPLRTWALRLVFCLARPQP